MIDLDRHGDVHILRMDDDENRYSPAMLDALSEALTSVAATEGPNALVTTGTGKFFSNGLDLDWLGAHSGEAGAYLARVHRLFAQVLALPCVTVAACNGHAYAGGAMLMLCHDCRVMRTGRGYWCLPEVDLGMSFTPAMDALIGATLPIRTAHEAMVTGRRYTAEEALDADIIDAAVDEEAVLPDAIAVAQTLAAKASPVMASIRTDRYAPAMALLTAGP